MRGMAVGADHLLITHWMGKGPLKLGTLLAVAAITGFGLMLAGLHRIMHGMHLMTIGAGGGGLLVRVTMPADEILLMTGQADDILLLNRKGLLAAKIQDGRPGFPGAQARTMIATGAMTRLALQGGKGGGWVCRLAVGRLEDALNPLGVVATQAGIRPLARVLWRWLLLLFIFLRDSKVCLPGGCRCLNTQRGKWQQQTDQ